MKTIKDLKSMDPSSISYEDLLAPILRHSNAHFVRRDRRPVQGAGFRPCEIIRFNNLSTDEEITNTINREAAKAFRRLLWAQLIAPEITGDHLFRITERGKRTLLDNPEELDEKYLESFQEYIDKLNWLRQKEIAEEWRGLRYQFYTAGRLLNYTSNSYAARVTLGYAIEYHLKAGLSLVEGRLSAKEKNVLKKHDFEKLFRTARDNGVFTDVYISYEFLKHAQEGLETRYPSGAEEILKKRKWIAFGVTSLPTFDDCITQLDVSLCNLSGRPTDSMGYQALAGFNEKDLGRRAFFFDNPFALQHLDKYKEILEASPYPFTSDPIPEARALRRCDNLGYPMWTFEKQLEITKFHLAHNFRCAKSPMLNPDPLAIRDKQSRVDFYSGHGGPVIDKALDILRSEFGEYSVVVDGDSLPCTVYVFDRTAKNFSAEINLNDEYHPLRIKDLKSAIEGEAGRIKKQFRNKRTGYNSPPNAYPTWKDFGDSR